MTAKHTPDKIKCSSCGISIPDVPEDATEDELLCNACYEISENTPTPIEACELIVGLMGNLSLDQIEQVNGINDGRHRAGQLRSAIEIAQAAIRKARGE